MDEDNYKKMLMKRFAYTQTALQVIGEIQAALLTQDAQLRVKLKELEGL